MQSTPIAVPTGTVSTGTPQTDSNELTTLLDSVDLRMLVPTSLSVGTGLRYVQMRCILHNDTKPSMSVYADGAYCYACGIQLNRQQFIARVYNLTTHEQISELIAQAKVQNTFTPVLANTLVQTPDQGLGRTFHLQLTDDAVEYYLRRGLTLDTIEQYQLGWGKLNEYCPEGYTIPIYTLNNSGQATLRQVKSRIPNATENKYRSLQGCGVWLYLSDDIQYQPRVILVEGEFDALILRQLGYIAVTPTGGVKSFRQHWTNQFIGSTLYCGYDDDDAGHQGWRKLQYTFDKPIRRIEWKKLSKSTDGPKDPTDAYLLLGEDYVNKSIQDANERFLTQRHTWK